MFLVLWALAGVLTGWVAPVSFLLFLSASLFIASIWYVCFILAKAILVSDAPKFLQPFLIGGCLSFFEYIKDIIIPGGALAGLTGFLPVVPPFSQLLDSLGPYGVLFIETAFLSGCALFVLKRRWVFGWVAALLIAFSGGYALARIMFIDMGFSDKSAYIYQPGITVEEKHGGISSLSIWERYLNGLKDAAILRENDNILLMPETSLMFPLGSPILEMFLEEMKEFGIDGLIAGANREEGENLYNSVAYMLLGDKGVNIRGIYDKNILVPFGEYIPDLALKLIKIDWQGLYDVASFYSKGEGVAAFDIDGATIIPLICFEDVFSPYVGRLAEAYPGGVFVVFTNDGWFGKGLGQAAHRNAAQMRAIEYRRPVIRVANDAFSAVISPTGRILQHAGFGRAVLETFIPVADNGKTLYQHVGNMPVFVIWLFCVIIILYYMRFIVKRR